MDNRDEIRTFLSSRRAKISPAQAGLPERGRRKVPGLRRGEVAELAGVSIEYYAQLERGNLSGASDSVLDALARALQLDEAERSHLYDLARAGGPATQRRRRSPGTALRPSVQYMLDGMTEVPAYVRNGRLDILVANALARALYAPAFDSPVKPANTARFNFLDPRARDFWFDWDRALDETVALLRTEAGRDPYDKGLSDLVGELSTRSDAFRTRWAAHDVRLHSTGAKHFRHPVVGELHLTYESLEMPGEPGLTMLVFTAEPGSPSADGLRMLASWSATQNSPTPR
ncbi:helix-turn-helix transcriptional regulator [Actinoplanes bogorensis]|uniref:Helix-turn-helix transcriptional regulator n=1 Tax=Paractinoplanes bogorensis TaxID=1610840 RepID=A0ABS5YEU9_9ACTN|nr:helix-turn-helix transcriptional regulator [Actinoplanes bogorensis]MBU2661933.1 helix-turn-helix transcriptional regulator [Actinoplanes bogorensis]